MSNEVVGAIGRGLVALVGIEKGDEAAAAERLAEKLALFRLFEDEAGKMNRSLADVGGAMLVVSQFTLAASTDKGRRPSFEAAAAPAHAELLYNVLIERLRARGCTVATGRFGARMEVELVNDGPATFLLRA